MKVTMLREDHFHVSSAITQVFAEGHTYSLPKATATVLIKRGSAEKATTEQPRKKEA